MRMYSHSSSSNGPFQGPILAYPASWFPLVLVVCGLGCQGGGTVESSAASGGGGGEAGSQTGPTGTGGVTVSLSAPTLQGANSQTCGNGVLDANEQCDDGNTVGGDGCSKTCQVEDGYTCPTPGKPCIKSAICGDGILTSPEVCDDGNTVGGDGCSADCSAVEPGWSCRVPGKKCVPDCGDGKVELGKQCDDGNTNSGDGCSSTCLIEPGWSCTGSPSVCTQAVCGNGIVEAGELCDCGNDPKNLPSGCEGVNGLFYGDGKGCSKTCTKEPSCQDANGNTQACSSTCGDGNLDPGEQCDDGNLVNGDGCSSTCQIENGFTCTTQTEQDSSTCQSGSGQCLELPIIYRDFQPENVNPGGHPDFYFYGTR